MARLSCQPGCLGGATGQGAESGSSTGCIQLSPEERQERNRAAGNPSPTTTLGSFMSYKDRLRIDADGLTLIRKYILQELL